MTIVNQLFAVCFGALILINLFAVFGLHFPKSWLPLFLSALGGFNITGPFPPPLWLGAVILMLTTISTIGFAHNAYLRANNPEYWIDPDASNQ